MPKERSTRPYLVRAIYEWCSDCGYTPYLSVKVNDRTRVPMEFVKNGEIVLNISPDATHRLTIGDDAVQFSARFSGVSRECSVPMDAIAGIFARENSQGIFFPAEPGAQEANAPSSDGEPAPTSPSNGGKRRLQVVK
jgi:stringent starvation protein B